MPTLSANAPDTVTSGVPFDVGAVLTGGPPGAPVSFVLEHVVGPGAVPAWAPRVVPAVTSPAGAAAVSFPGVVLTSVGMHGLYCVANDPVTGFLASDAESVAVR
jgi:hypothetical protein